MIVVACLKKKLKNFESVTLSCQLHAVSSRKNNQELSLPDFSGHSRKQKTF
jgi:hypothetical protein